MKWRSNDARRPGDARFLRTFVTKGNSALRNLSDINRLHYFPIAFRIGISHAPTKVASRSWGNGKETPNEGRQKAIGSHNPQQRYTRLPQFAAGQDRRAGRRSAGGGRPLSWFFRPTSPARAATRPTPVLG